MKTPQQWAEHLPEPIRTQFLENIDKGYNEETKTLSHSIYRSFTWHKTAQGAQYWLDVYVKSNAGKYEITPPKPIPREIQLLRDVETEVNISGIISNHTYSEIVKLLKEVDEK